KLTATPSDTTLKVRATLTGCVGEGDGERITRAEVRGTLHVFGGVCAPGTMTTSGQLTVKYYTAARTPKLAPSTVDFVNVDIQRTRLFVAGAAGQITGGSFAGTTLDFGGGSRALDCLHQRGLYGGASIG